MIVDVQFLLDDRAWYVWDAETVSEPFAIHARVSRIDNWGFEIATLAGIVGSFLGRGVVMEGSELYYVFFGELVSIGDNGVTGVGGNGTNFVFEIWYFLFFMGNFLLLFSFWSKINANLSRNFFISSTYSRLRTVDDWGSARIVMMYSAACIQTSSIFNAGKLIDFCKKDHSISIHFWFFSGNVI